MTFPNWVHGTAGVLGAESVDGRTIDPAGFIVEACPLPLMALHPRPGGDLADGHAGAVLAGRIDHVLVDSTTGRVLITDAVTDLPPGQYPCGMDLRDVTVKLTKPDGSLLTEDELRNDTHLQLVHRFTTGTLIGVTVYVDGAARPVFPGALLTVEAGR